MMDTKPSTTDTEAQNLPRQDRLPRTRAQQRGIRRTRIWANVLGLSKKEKTRPGVSPLVFRSTMEVLISMPSYFCQNPYREATHTPKAANPTRR